MHGFTWQGAPRQSDGIQGTQYAPAQPRVPQHSPIQSIIWNPLFWVLQRIAMDAVARVFRDRRCLCNAPSHSRQPNTCKYFQRSFCYVQSLHRSIVTRKVGTVGSGIQSSSIIHVCRWYIAKTNSLPPKLSPQPSPCSLPRALTMRSLPLPMTAFGSLTHRTCHARRLARLAPPSSPNCARCLC